MVALLFGIFLAFLKDQKTLFMSTHKAAINTDAKSWKRQIQCKHSTIQHRHQLLPTPTLVVLKSLEPEKTVYGTKVDA